MITRHDDERGETLYGDAPLIDHDGYALEVIDAPTDAYMGICVATEPTGPCPKIRAELTTPQVRELRDRCDAYLNDHQEKP